MQGLFEVQVKISQHEEGYFDTALESPDFILFDSEKNLVIRIPRPNVISEDFTTDDPPFSENFEKTRGGSSVSFENGSVESSYRLNRLKRTPSPLRGAIENFLTFIFKHF